MQNEVSNAINTAATAVPPDLSAHIQTRLVGLMDYLTETAKIVDSTAKEQLPLFIRDIIAWEFYSNLAWLVLGLVGLIVGLTLVIRFLYRVGSIYKKLPEYSGDYDYRRVAETLRDYFVPPTIITAVAGAILTIPSLICTMSHIESTIKPAVAPRIVILDYVKQAVGPSYGRR